MAITRSTTATALAGTLVVDLVANAGIENNVTGNTSGRIYLVDIDNTANTTDAVYLRIADAASIGSVSSDHTWMFYAPAGQRLSYAIQEGALYAAGVTTWCTSNPASGNGTAPTSSVVVRLVAS